MFNFMDYDMPSMFGSTMRGAGRPSHRRFNTSSFFEPESEPIYFNEPRRTITSRQRPSYNDEEYDMFGSTRRDPRSSFGVYGRPYHQDLEEEELRQKAINEARRAQRQRQQQPRRAQQQRPSEQFDHQYSRAKRDEAKPSSRLDSFWDMYSPESVLRASQTPASRSNLTKNNRDRMNEEDAVPKTTRASTSAAYKPQNMDGAANEAEWPWVETKAKKDIGQERKVPVQPTKANKTGKSVTQKPTNIKSDVKQDKRDLVIIEDVTPAKPKHTSTKEPANGLIIEEIVSKKI